MCSITIHFMKLPDFKVLHSTNMTSGGNYRETDIDVAVFKHRHDEAIYKRIEEQHNHINGEPNILTINLYRSEAEPMKGTRPYTTIYIDYDSGTREIRNKQ